MKFRFVSVLLSSALLCAALTSCGASSLLNKDDSSDSSSKSAEKTTVSTEKETVADDGQFHFDNAVKSVEVCGKEVGYPFSINDLGDDFSLDTKATSMSSGEQAVVVYHNDDTYGIITYLSSEINGEINRDTVSSGIYVYAENYADYAAPPITVNGISLGDKREKVEAEFGKSELNRDDVDRYWETSGKEKYIEFDYEDEKHETVTGIVLAWY